MAAVNTDLIKEAIYKLCYDANIRLNKDIYNKIKNAYQNCSNNKAKKTLSYILQNAKTANENKRPLCQDTGQVLIFLELGQKVHIEGEGLNEAIDTAVRKCYEDNFFRKSIVKDALLERENTKTNTPVIIYTDIVQGNSLKINVLIKGAGSENKSKSEMLLPTASKDAIKEFIAKSILESGTSSCPPLFIGVGIGGTQDRSALLAKKALITGNKNKTLSNFAMEIQDYINKNAPDSYKDNYVLDLAIITTSTHIASMPVSISINCHSSRKAHCTIEDDKIIYEDNDYDFIDIKNTDESLTKILASETEKIKNLKQGENILLSGEIYVARDAAHKKLIDLISENKPLPIDIKDKIILYAGPCPAKPGEVIGPIGPTTSSRMDKYAPVLYDMGLLATIGKGERNEEVIEAIRRNSAVYLTMTGGIASLIAQKIKKSEVIAFEELGAEAIYKIEVENLPLNVAITG